MIFLIAISLGAWLLSSMIAVSEVIHERSWPKDTGVYPFVFGFTTLILMCAV